MKPSKGLSVERFGSSEKVGRNGSRDSLRELLPNAESWRMESKKNA